jgi:hypothetical protein
MSKRKLDRKSANFEFALHADTEKGPNRVTFEPERAVKFFKKLKARDKYSAAKVKHLYTNLVWETDDVEELEHFISTVVKTVGVSVYE